MRLRFLSLLSLVACGGVNSGQPLEHPASPEAALGRGFNSLSGQTRGSCVEPSPVNRPPNRGHRLVETVFHARSKEEILHEVGYSGGFNFGIFGVGLDLGFESLNRSAQSANTSFAVIRIHIEAPSETLRDYRLERHAAETLRRGGPGKFYETCGDGFVAAIRQGGYFLGIVALKGVSAEDSRRLSGEAGVSFLGFGVRGGAHTDTRNFLERHQARYYILQEGGDPTGVRTLRQLEDLDSLLRRAEAFKQAVSGGQAVPTRLVVEPYQVTSNRPRRAKLWNLTEQRRFLDRLAIDFGALQQAEAELREKLASARCARKGARRKLESLLEEYQQSVRATRQRAEDCVNDPQSNCSDRRLSFVDPERHRKAMALCAAPELAPGGRLGPIAAQPPARPLRRGVDEPCRTWRFQSAHVQVAPSKPGGAAWDADGSPPETAFTLWLGERKIGFPVRQSYASGGEIVDGFVSAGATVKARLTDRDALFDDSIAMIADTVPKTLDDGVWRLESGRTSVSLSGRCID